MKSTAIVNLRFKKNVPKDKFDQFTVMFLRELINEGYFVRYSEIEFEEGVRVYKIQLTYEKGVHYSLRIKNSTISWITLSFSKPTDELEESYIKGHDERVRMALDFINLKEEK